MSLGLEYIAHKMTKTKVKTVLTKKQAGRVYWIFRDLRRRTKEDDEAGFPVRFVNLLFKKKIKLHRSRGLGPSTWKPSEVVSWDAMARMSTR